jgi:hypothetical protein
MTAPTDDAEAALVHSAVTQVLYRYCRGMDRMDADLTRTCFEPDALLDYTNLYRGDPAGFVDWLWPVHAGMVGHTHAISNVLLEFGTNREPRTEAYVQTTLRMQDGADLIDLVSTGRYLDRWRHHDNGWRISGRTYIPDLSTVRPVEKRDLSHLFRPVPDKVPVRGSRDRTDPSYQVLVGRS